MIDPSIWESPEVTQLTAREFRLYVFTISQADDDGRLRFIPKKWAASLAPESDDYNTSACEQDADRLVLIGLLHAYEVDGSIYLHHPNWTTYQTINKPTPSKLPEPTTGVPVEQLRESLQESLQESLPERLPESVTESLPPKIREGKRRKGRGADLERFAVGYDVADDESSQPEEVPPDGGEAHASLSPLKDPLANHYQNRFIEVQPVSSWGNVAKERGLLSVLAKKTRELRRDAPVIFSDDVELANVILSQFMALRRSEKSEFWRNAPFSPSGLATRWDQVITALQRSYEREERDREGEEALSWLTSG
jgi:hypothetical protein